MKIVKIILGVAIGSIILTGTGIGIWLGVRNTDLGIHPDDEWELMITGNIIGDDFNLTLTEITSMPYFEQGYIIKGSTTVEYVYRGVSISHLIANEIPVEANATTITFVAIDQYEISFSISELTSDDANILAYARNGQYLLNQTAGGNGYLRLIIPQTSEDDFNGPSCLKWIVEIKIA
ncbi:MAG: molybdopterin-dependent oxidoreductase [Asgard group archaeon]|nr:molybdopterin-dependent oxidoreductase [Asgard group archaeon]